MVKSTEMPRVRFAGAMQEECLLADRLPNTFEVPSRIEILENTGVERPLLSHAPDQVPRI